MKNKGKISLVLIACITITSYTNVHAKDIESNVIINNNTVYREVENKELLNDGYQDDISVIKENGYSEADIQDLSMDTISEVADALEEDSDSVQISTGVYTFDELQNIEVLANLSEEELVSQCGLSKQKAKEIKKQFKSFENMSNNQIKKEYNLNDGEVALLRKALRKQSNYKPYKAIKDDDKVTLSSTISSSKLSFTQTVVNNSTYKNGKRTNSNYKVTESFSWLKCYYPWGFTDTIGVAWSGGYTYSTSSKSISYYNMKGVLPSFTWGAAKGSKNASADGTASKGCKYSFSQAYSSSLSNIAYAKSGKIVLNLTQSGYAGKKAQVISKYCHKVLAPGSVSVSSSPSVTVSVKASYQTTDTDDTNNSIYY